MLNFISQVSKLSCNTRSLCCGKGEKIMWWNHVVALTLVLLCPLSNWSEICSYAPLKFHDSSSKLSWVIMFTDRHTQVHTHRQAGVLFVMNRNFSSLAIFLYRGIKQHIEHKRKIFKKVTQIMLCCF